MVRPRNRWTSIFLLLAGGAVTGLILSEIGLRIYGFSSPSFYTRDPVLGWRFRPGAEGWQRREGDAYVRINHEGFRDYDHSVDKPPGTLRIAVLGDSVVAALQVPMEKTFWSVLERKLAECPALGGKRIKVLNFGVDGYGTAQEFLVLQNEVWKYSPDLVLLVFMTGNDVRNNYRTLNEDPTLEEGHGEKLNSSPYFVSGSTQLTLDDSFCNSPQLQPDYLRRRNLMADIMNRVRLLQLINWIENLRNLESNKLEAQALPLDPARSELVFGCIRNQPCRKEELVDKEGVSLDNLVYYPPKAKAWKEAWLVTEGLLLRIRDDVRRHGAEFWIMIATTGRQVHPDRAVRQAFMKKLGVDTLLYPDLRLQTFAEHENIPVVMLADPMGEYAVAQKVFLHGFKNTEPGEGHWNEVGHRVAGEILASRLCAAQARDSGR